MIDPMFDAALWDTKPADPNRIGDNPSIHNIHLALTGIGAKSLLANRIIQSTPPLSGSSTTTNPLPSQASSAAIQPSPSPSPPKQLTQQVQHASQHVGPYATTTTIPPTSKFHPSQTVSMDIDKRAPPATTSSIAAPPSGAHNIWSQQRPHPSPSSFASPATSTAPPSSSSSNPPTSGWGFDRDRDARDRDAALRNAEQSGWAPSKPSLQTRVGGIGASNGPEGQNENRKPPSAWSTRDRDRGFEDVEGDERAIPSRYAKRARTESPEPPLSPSSSAPALASNPFITGNAKLADDLTKKFGSRAAADQVMKRQREESIAAGIGNAPPQPKSLGGKRNKFTPPYRKAQGEDDANNTNASASSSSSTTVSGPTSSLTPMMRAALAGPNGKEGEVHEKLRGLDPKLIESIMNEMMESPGVQWSDIAGLEFAKKSVREIVVWPILRPELFTGLRGPPKGLLLFGPPGTGQIKFNSGIESALWNGRFADSIHLPSCCSNALFSLFHLS